jgi:hypothetical protein
MKRSTIGVRITHKEEFRSLDALLSLFDPEHFDAININGDKLKLWKRKIGESHLIEQLEILHFLADENKVTERSDQEIYIIISMILRLTEEEKREVMDMTSFRGKKLFELVASKRHDESIVYAHPSDQRIPFARDAVKIAGLWKRCCNNNNNVVARQITEENPFRLEDWLGGKDPYRRFVSHLQEMTNLLFNNRLTKTWILKELVTVTNYRKRTDSSATPLRYVTGQSCCGKSTVLRVLSETEGWTIYSRADIGSFSGKSKSPLDIAMLHAALEEALCAPDVIGDRGPIDNPLWTIIMHMCDPNVEIKHMVRDMLRLFQSHMNSLSMRYFSSHIVAVFLDIDPLANQKRQLARDSGGDCFRAKIARYQIAQTLAYYMAFILFGWKLFLVPYDEKEEYPRQARYSKEYMNQTMASLVKMFGTPSKRRSKKKRFEKPDGLFEPSLKYAKDVGIFK